MVTRIAVIPGDGIGVEVTREAVRVLEAAAEAYGLALEMTHFDWGAEKYLREGIGLPEGAVEMLQREYDAILAGAFGDPRIPDHRHAREILLGLRVQLDLFVNLRPVKLLDERLTPLKGRTPDDIDFVIVRENTEGAYVDVGGVFKKGTLEEVAIQEEITTRRGTERIIVAAFEYARRQRRRRVTLVDKSNVLRYGHGLWQRVFWEVAERYPEIEATHQYVDAMALRMVQDPASCDVIVTTNMFGDILSDLGAALIGGLGLAPSGNIHPGRISLFEPVHGTAPELAGKGVANPMGAILTAAMLLDYVGAEEAARAIERAVVATIQAGEVTRDLGGSLSTEDVGRAIAARVRARTL
ncbi:MAG: 3-isopropylmalate dehydrogenase [Blastocatellia bacterium]|nr:3-isopropylmalate dehydrogenase [Blastocatellia bacterium]MCS7156572.1 3-isopropylmalate dehydrogenase [Blastocatellia bacterium]MCX7751687.1 3-isopropylmalate dehydrogenase [Blastocatellia bacterium]MDW8168788.1 3-isopropylmalate dehydrogenase [Acidobacteriota bacterium]MDW8255673.1 3-isopropylmalate dehydrogenase [Acidobacteriota bacterium]